MNATAVLRESRARGIRLEVRAGTLIVDAPRGALDPTLREALVACKPELLAILDPASERWGPALEDDEPPIVIPADDWRWTVVHWPNARWRAWHELALQLAPTDATAEEIREAQRAAYDLVAGRPDPIPDRWAESESGQTAEADEWPTLPDIDAGWSPSRDPIAEPAPEPDADRPPPPLQHRLFDESE